jgi:hypothetical protein
MNQARYERQVRRCAAELRMKLPKLAERHPALVLIAALTEEVGGGLYLTQEDKLCTPERARAIIQRVEQIAFSDHPEQRPPPQQASG